MSAQIRSTLRLDKYRSILPSIVFFMIINWS